MQEYEVLWWVCVCVCLSASRPRSQRELSYTSSNFMCMLTMVLAQPFSGTVVLCVMSSLHITGHIQIQHITTSTTVSYVRSMAAVTRFTASQVIYSGSILPTKCKVCYLQLTCWLHNSAIAHIHRLYMEQETWISLKCKPVKKLSGGMLAWLSGMRCRLAYSPAYATATHYLLLQ